MQGLTEFLPVSSSGHLELGKVLLGDTSLPQESMMFTIVVHLATALSTLVVFRADVFQITKGLFSDLRGPEWQFSLKIVLSMIPAALVGVSIFKGTRAAFRPPNPIGWRHALADRNLIIYCRSRSKYRA